jgi:DNA repair exonuclease SbcCD ATPase subunit
MEAKFAEMEARIIKMETQLQTQNEKNKQLENKLVQEEEKNQRLRAVAADSQCPVCAPKVIDLQNLPSEETFIESQ